MYNYGCTPKCPAHFYSSNGVCLGIFYVLIYRKECHETCKECFDSTRKGCTSCYSEAIFLDNSCVNDCPPYTFKNSITNLCEQCVEPCEQCSSLSRCQSCMNGYYKWPNSDDCKTFCPEDMFPNKETRMCEQCSESCSGCTGPSNRDCVTCNYLKGYAKYNIYECKKVQCDDGTFLTINSFTRIVKCELCHESCLTCINDQPNGCIECKPKYKKFQSDDNEYFICSTCEKYKLGYYTNNDGSCKGIFLESIKNKKIEICGDGINLKHYQCDDGNRFNGDGCSEDCKVEFGFKCINEGINPSKCVDILSPKAKLLIHKATELTIKFSEVIVIQPNIQALINTLNITIIGTLEPCKVEWQIFNLKYLETDTLIIKTIPHCSLQTNRQLFMVHFTVPKIVQDYSENVLATPVLYAKTKKYSYISDSEKAALSAAGSAFSGSSIFTLFFMIGLSLLQSAAIGSFWAFVNMLQILSFMPIIECFIPYNLEIFLTEYLTIKKIVFPFYLIPDFILSPIRLISSFLTSPLNDRFLIAGYDSLSFIFNFGEELYTWVLLLFLYLALRFLCWLIPKTKYNCIQNIIKKMFIYSYMERRI